MGAGGVGGRLVWVGELCVGVGEVVCVCDVRAISILSFSCS